MKKSISTLIILFSAIHLLAQISAEKIAEKVCVCIGNIGTIDSLESKFIKCIGPSMAEVMDNTKDVKFETTVENIQSLGISVFQLLPSVCPAVKKLLPEDKAEKFYKLSSSSAANTHYNKGNTLLQNNDFEGAIKEFKEAIKSDDKFILALDNLAVCYRHLGQLQEAIRFYKQSLNIFPDGEFALVNLGVIYILQNDLDKAEEHYAKIIALYPSNPEGYFGIAKTALLREKYEDALAPICKAHRIYVSTRSSHVAESERVIGFIYTKFKEAGKVETFQEIVKQHDIEFEIK